MRTIVAGCRELGFASRDDIWYTLDRHYDRGHIGKLVCGMARGVDQEAREWANTAGVPIDEYHADWEQHGKAAGPIRNAQMADNADRLIAFWDGHSRGTCDMLKTALDKGLLIHLYHLEPGCRLWWES